MRPGIAPAACALCLLLAGGCADDNGLPPRQNGDRDTLAVTLQDGVHPNDAYFGTRDAVIKDGPTPALNQSNFGAESLDTVGVVRAGGGLYERRLLVRIDLSGLSGCSAVIDARLSLRIESTAADSLVLEIFEVDVPDAYPGWTEGTGGLAAGVSWLTVDGAAPWTSEGGDYGIAALDTQAVRADSAVTFSLPGWLVLGWIQQPSSNDGVIVKAGDTSGERFTLINLRESDNPVYRPRLDLLYFKSG